MQTSWRGARRERRELNLSGVVRSDHLIDDILDEFSTLGARGRPMYRDIGRGIFMQLDEPSDTQRGVSIEAMRRVR